MWRSLSISQTPRHKFKKKKLSQTPRHKFEKEKLPNHLKTNIFIQLSEQYNQ